MKYDKHETSHAAHKLKFDSTSAHAHTLRAHVPIRSRVERFASAARSDSFPACEAISVAARAEARAVVVNETVAAAEERAAATAVGATALG